MEDLISNSKCLVNLSAASLNMHCIGVFGASAVPDFFSCGSNEGQGAGHGGRY